MDLIVPLPESIQSKLDNNTHPSLALDKYVMSWEPGAPPGKLSERVQKPAIDKVVELSQREPRDCNFQGLHARRTEVLRLLGAEVFGCKTTGPLTLHLARASALENAGICLHPLYGFTYFPGSGLKGMARAFAETVWFPAQFAAGGDGQPVGAAEEQKATEAWAKIEQVFGWAPFSDTLEKGATKPWKSRCVPEHSQEDGAQSGSIVFHDAWPEQWPPLYMDILNNHHSGYYQGKDAPGVWENPIPVYFLAVVPDQVFSFAVYKRTSQTGGSLLALAKEWLLGGLCHLGTGAKTAAGYGNFVPVEAAAPPLKSPARPTFQATLELVAPAFLAGAKQQKEDCDLRGATLRGMLRWWWRTMHAGFVDVPALGALETAVWGDTSSGGAVRLTLAAENALQPQQYNYKDRFRPQPEFKRAHGLQDSPNTKTTQGLFYLSYGMDERSHDEARHRWYMPAGQRWRISLSARRTSYEERNARGDVIQRAQISAPAVLEQARAALWLLCKFGAVGSKALKGFGSFNDVPGMTLEECQSAAREFRASCGVRQHLHDSDSPALETMLPTLEVATRWVDPWFAVDQLGFSAQGFAQEFKHRPEKLGLGLPRKIHGPRDNGPIQGTQDVKNWKPPVWLGELHPKLGRRKPRDMRDASPVHYHFAKAADGALTIRVTAFPARYLPETATSRKFLSGLLEYLKADLEKRARDFAAKGQQKPATSVAPSASVSRPAAAGRRLPKQGDTVEAVMVEDPKGKGRRFARHVASGMVGNIQNSAEIPPDKKTGDQVQLIVAICTPPDQIQFKWPKPEGARGPDKPTPRSKTSDDRPRR
jgi:CRISPR-associated protein Cmr6